LAGRAHAPYPGPSELSDIPLLKNLPSVAFAEPPYGKITVVAIITVLKNTPVKAKSQVIFSFLLKFFCPIVSNRLNIYAKGGLGEPSGHV
jgi:hypothetical protein